MARVEKIVFEGQAAWRKRPESIRSNVYTNLHKLVSPVLPSVFKATNTVGGVQALLEEASRLKAFAASGILVPEVLAVNNDSIVLAHVGLSLPEEMLNLHDDAQKAALLEKASKALAYLHSAGHVHGRPSLKDMFLSKDGEVYILDLEEDPLTIMSLSEGQARDAWLFLSSAHRVCGFDEHTLNRVLKVYLKHLENPIDDEIKALTKKLRPLLRVFDFLKLKKLGRDLKAALMATKVFDTNFQ